MVVVSATDNAQTDMWYMRVYTVISRAYRNVEGTLYITVGLVSASAMLLF